MSNEIENRIRQTIKDNKILLFMKGSPASPSCGFSAKASQIVMSYGKPFSFIDVLNDSEARTFLPLIANWPTFPQLWVDGELIGGCDIIDDMHKSGELSALLNE